MTDLSYDFCTHCRVICHLHQRLNQIVVQSHEEIKLRMVKEEFKVFDSFYLMNCGRSWKVIVPCNMGLHFTFDWCFETMRNAKSLPEAPCASEDQEEHMQEFTNSFIHIQWVSSGYTCMREFYITCFQLPSQLDIA